MTTRILTGITTTGTPHLQLRRAIRLAILASRDAAADSFYFLADYHALIKCDDPLRIQRSRLEIAATWLACGLDAERVTFYRQSDVPEIPELTWLLTCVTAKGPAQPRPCLQGLGGQECREWRRPDAGVTMGLYSYPVLMAADILMFNAHKVPVGRDQIQHVEMARDIAQRFNHLFGNGREFFTLPEAVIEESVATLPGLDGRKMSKSYDNTIPLFGSAKELKAAIARIVTDSRLPGEPKDPDNSHLFTLYQAFATAQQQADFRQELLDGLAWGDAKQRLFELLDNELGQARELYHQLIAKPAELEDILQAERPGTPDCHTIPRRVARGGGAAQLQQRSEKRGADQEEVQQDRSFCQLPRGRWRLPLPLLRRRRRGTAAVPSAEQSEGHRQPDPAPDRRRRMPWNFARTKVINSPCGWTTNASPTARTTKRRSARRRHVAGARGAGHACRVTLLAGRARPMGALGDAVISKYGCPRRADA